MTGQPETLSGALARWACGLSFADIPREVIEDAKLRLLDTLGVTVAASVTDAGRVVRDASLRIGPGDTTRILGFGDRAAAAGAAIANGTMAHVHDYDDTHAAARVHISAPVVTAALASGQAMQANGRAILTAIIAGSEMTARLGVHGARRISRSRLSRRPASRRDRRGRYCRHDDGALPPALQNAIGIAASQAAGIAECFTDGTWTKRLHAGWAAHIAASPPRSLPTAASPVRSGHSTANAGCSTRTLAEADHPYSRVTGRSWQPSGCARGRRSSRIPAAT